MKGELPSWPRPSTPRAVRWLAWMVLILFGGTLVVALVLSTVNLVTEGLDARKLPWLLGIALFVVTFLALKAAFHPIHGRADKWLISE